MTLSPDSSRASLFGRLKRLLASGRVVLWCALLAALLTAPSIATGLHTEDLVQRELVEHGDYRIPWKMNLYGHHGPWTWESVEEINRKYKVYGWFPWITHKRFDVSFWRPLASLTHIIDYRYFSGAAWLMHAENVLWYALLAAAAGLLYRRLIDPRWIAGLAALLYAVDDAHGHAVGWLANRNGIMATFFGVLSLWAFDRWRRDGWKPGAPLTAALLALGLTSAELALSAAGFFIAYGLFVEQTPIRRRLLASLVWLAPIGGWALVYRLLGHSSYGSGLYINPLSEPVSFSFEVVERAVVLLMGQLGTPPSNLWSWVDRDDQGYVVFWAALFVLFVGKMLLPILRRDRRARFWACGGLLALAPACAAFPEDRLLFFVGIGAMPLVGLFLAECIERGAELYRRRRLAWALAGFFVLLHGVAAPLLLPYRSLYMHRYDSRIRETGERLFRFVDDPALDSLIVVNGEDFYFIGMMPLTRVARGKPTVGRMVTLAGTLDPIRLRRLDAHTIEVRPEGGFLTRVFNRIYRGRSHPMRRGRRLNLLGVEIEVTEVNQWGEPLEAKFQFALPLDHSRLNWVVYRDGDYHRFTPPKVGESVVVSGE